ncbi:unnamed protein product [Protopolystoma xenopodis]|uniref:Uncharacterized protein n=1 Tax=Protopolystoma xenopodis TaxID=117903 RepID=A0A448WAH5_9PLAT|nr:unnamed protein product [Protopolystoma xenopodis]
MPPQTIKGNYQAFLRVINSIQFANGTGKLFVDEDTILHPMYIEAPCSVMQISYGPDAQPFFCLLSCFWPGFLINPLLASTNVSAVVTVTALVILPYTNITTDVSSLSIIVGTSRRPATQDLPSPLQYSLPHPTSPHLSSRQRPAGRFVGPFEARRRA